MGNSKTHAHPLTMAQNPVILLRPEDIRARLNYQQTMHCHSHKNFKCSVILIYGNKIRQAISGNNKF